MRSPTAGKQWIFAAEKLVHHQKQILTTEYHASGRIA
jgi:hypothetical protein